ncbi:hypothetical protein ACFSUK_09435 [Sphingobium scionense]|uniref:Uncharacterized protein n=1 Tax=Sphingobium scionense TaxID=1404341 RepID=A0A7W6PV54_9SPHN|nr:hypothetical protein [Sphingobium scionense]MBB4146877.1 hypothetical protein [Sphingobium scionense]
MKGLLKLAFLTGLGAVAWKSLKDRSATDCNADPKDVDDRGPVGSSGIVRDAGPQTGDSDWDMIDEQSDESFPASDPPGNY